jgi:hypothetical protein
MAETPLANMTTINPADLNLAKASTLEQPAGTGLYSPEPALTVIVCVTTRRPGALLVAIETGG